MRNKKQKYGRIDFKDPETKKQWGFGYRKKNKRARVKVDDSDNSLTFYFESFVGDKNTMIAKIANVKGVAYLKFGLTQDSFEDLIMSYMEYKESKTKLENL